MNMEKFPFNFVTQIPLIVAPKRVEGKRERERNSHNKVRLSVVLVHHTDCEYQLSSARSPFD